METLQNLYNFTDSRPIITEEHPRHRFPVLIVLDGDCRETLGTGWRFIIPPINIWQSITEELLLWSFGGSANLGKFDLTV